MSRSERIEQAARGLIVRAFRLGGGACFIGPDQDGVDWLWSGDGRDPEGAEPVLCLSDLSLPPDPADEARERDVQGSDAWHMENLLRAALRCEDIDELNYLKPKIAHRLAAEREGE